LSFVPNWRTLLADSLLEIRRARHSKMATKIGIRNVQTMPPNTFLWDSKVRGFHARRQFGDAVTFAVFYRNNEGRQRWHKIGRYGVWTVAEARQQAQKILRARDLGEDPTAERMALGNAITIAALCDEYVADMQAGKINGKKASTIKTDVSRIATHIKPALGKRKVTGVTQDDVEQFMRGVSPGSARRNVGLLGAIFSYAVKRKLRTDNPVHGVDKPADVKRMRRVSEAEYAQLWSALLKRVNVASEVVLFLAVTGWRSGEAKDLKFSEVDLERRTATLDDTKTGLSVRPLSGAAIEIIKRKRVREGQQFVFEHKHAKPISNLTPWWNRLGLDKTITPHVLRHSFASLAADLGLPDHTISGLLGHARQGVTSRYMHLGDKALLEAADLVANETVRLMQSAVHC
jgi:integrase